MAPHLSHHRAGFPFLCVGSVEKNQTGIRRNRRFLPTEESQRNHTPDRIKCLGDRVLLVWEISEQTTLYRALVLLRSLAAREETLASLPHHRSIILEPPRAKLIAQEVHRGPHTPVEPFPTPEHHHRELAPQSKLGGNCSPPRVFFWWSPPFKEVLGETPITSSLF
jgi:hypothetical protein